MNFVGEKPCSFAKKFIANVTYTMLVVYNVLGVVGK